MSVGLRLEFLQAYYVELELMKDIIILIECLLYTRHFSFINSSKPHHGPMKLKHGDVKQLASGPTFRTQEVAALGFEPREPDFRTLGFGNSLSRG